MKVYAIVHFLAYEGEIVVDLFKNKSRAWEAAREYNDKLHKSLTIVDGDGRVNRMAKAPFKFGRTLLPTDHIYIEERIVK